MPTKITVYDPCRSRDRKRAWKAHEKGEVALFQRRLPDGDIQYEAHTLTPRSRRFLDFVSSNISAFTQGV